MSQPPKLAPPTWWYNAYNLSKLLFYLHLHHTISDAPSYGRVHKTKIISCSKSKQLHLKGAITLTPFLIFSNNNRPPVDFEESKVCKPSNIVSGNASFSFSIISE